jgi:hypothetical protein
MSRITKTTLVALAIVAGTTAGVLAQTKSVRLDPLSKDLYQLTYLNQGKCKVMVEVHDENGTRLLSDQIKRKRSFTKVYSFSNLDPGSYSFKITDGVGEYVTTIQRSDEVFMIARIKKISEKKAKVIVRGEFMEPISVNIFNGNDVKIHVDKIDSQKSFSKVYDLSKVSEEELRIDVVAEQKILAAAKF